MVCKKACMHIKTVFCYLVLSTRSLILSFTFHRVNHSKNAIVKPQAKHPDTAQREMEEAMKKVMEAQQLIDTAIEPGKNYLICVCKCSNSAFRV